MDCYKSYSGNQSGLPLEDSSLPENKGPTTSLAEFQNWLEANGNPAISHMQQQYGDLMYDNAVLNETADEAFVKRTGDNYERGNMLFDALTPEQKKVFLDAKAE